MGLAIARTIVEAHGGQLTGENNADEGATFRFTIPVATVGGR
jgi:two-component system sensor kinase FixL